MGRSFWWYFFTFLLPIPQQYQKTSDPSSSAIGNWVTHPLCKKKKHTLHYKKNNMPVLPNSIDINNKTIDENVQIVPTSCLDTWFTKKINKVCIEWRRTPILILKTRRWIIQLYIYTAKYRDETTITVTIWHGGDAMARNVWELAPFYTDAHFRKNTSGEHSI